MSTPTASQRRIDANRRNALRSTGPRTAEGKAKSRRNSLVHGLSGAGIVVPQEQAQAAHDRAAQWNSSLRPMNAFEVSLVETIAVESLRIERCRVEERLARDSRARRSAVCWADERKADTAKLGRTLPSKPEETAARLAITAPGCDWMIDRWRALGHALDKAGTWTDEQAALALDLLGIAPELRDLPGPLDPTDETSPLDHRQDLVDDQLERLLGRKESGLDDIEEDEREAAILGLSTGDDRTLNLLRRYETASFRRMKWALELMHKGRSRPVDPTPNPKWDDDAPSSRSPYPTPEEVERGRARTAATVAERTQSPHAVVTERTQPGHAPSHIPRLAACLGDISLPFLNDQPETRDDARPLGRNSKTGNRIQRLRASRRRAALQQLAA
ncbi:hypothetical protein EP7_000695 [Isosphaeraceae bacterium EP7]